MKNKKSSGIDDIPILVLKSCACHIAEPLRYLIQLSYDADIFPNKLKFLSNYRTIKLLLINF